MGRDPRPIRRPSLPMVVRRQRDPRVRGSGRPFGRSLSVANARKGQRDRARPGAVVQLPDRRRQDRRDPLLPRPRRRAGALRAVVGRVRVLAIFGPTAVGKTGVAVEVAARLRERGEDPVAVSCDALQVYRGLETLTAAPSPAERGRLEHRLVGVAEVEEEFSAGRFAELARREIDELLAEGRRPLVVGGTGLYLRAALAELELRPPVPAEVRDAV